MTLLPEDQEYLRALVEGRSDWATFPQWFAMNAHRLARMLDHDQLRRLRHHLREGATAILRHFGMTLAMADREGPERTSGAAPCDDWTLYLCVERDASLATLSRLQQVLGLPMHAVLELRSRLPGVYERGQRDELEPAIRPLLPQLDRVSLYRFAAGHKT